MITAIVRIALLRKALVLKALEGMALVTTAFMGATQT